MKIYQKRFCVECNGERGAYVVQHAGYAMFHCRECRQEVARVGDVRGETRSKRIAGGEAPRAADEEITAGMWPTDRACANPDVLSDEHSLWPRRDEEAEAEREDALRTFKVALAGLTARQRQVLEAVRQYKTQTRAAVSLGISQPVVKKTLDSVKKKLGYKGING